jgi:hypothetical protein
LNWLQGRYHRPVDQDLYYSARGTLHLNVKYVGGGLLTRVIASHFPRVKPEQIEWIWIAEYGRKATQEEVELLCSGRWANTR